WEQAAVIDTFTQVEPLEGRPPTEHTQVRLLYDADNVYVAVHCFDSEPAKILAKQMQRDGEFESDDTISIVLDTFLDHRNGYYFALSAAGGKADGLIEPGMDIRTEWDGIWYGKSRIAADGWTAE